MPRSRSIALQRTSDAVRLFRDGHTYERIAKTVGYANRGTAYRVVNNAFREQIVEDIEFHRHIELGALDLVKSVLWDIIDSTDDPNVKIRACGKLLVACKQRAKLLGLLDHPPQGEPQVLIRRGPMQHKEGNICAKTGEPNCAFEPRTAERQRDYAGADS